MLDLEEFLWKLFFLKINIIKRGWRRVGGSPAALPSPDLLRLSLLAQPSPGPARRSDALGKTCQGRVNNTLGSDLKDAKLARSSALMQNAGWQRCCIPSPNPILKRRVWDCCYFFFFFPLRVDAKL